MVVLLERFLGPKPAAIPLEDKRALFNPYLTHAQDAAIDVIGKVLPAANRTTKYGLRYGLVGCLREELGMVGSEYGPTGVRRVDLILANTARYNSRVEEGYTRKFAQELEDLSYELTGGYIWVWGNKDLKRQDERLYVPVNNQSDHRMVKVHVMGGKPYDTGYLHSARDPHNLTTIMLVPPTR